MEYGIAFMLEHSVKYLNISEEIIGTDRWKAIEAKLQNLDCRSYSVQVLLSFRFFNQFLDSIYTEANYESWNSPDVEILLNLIELFLKHNLVCSKAVLKLVYYKLSCEDSNE